LEGGVLETVVPEQTGLFSGTTTESILTAVDLFKTKNSMQNHSEHAEKFSKNVLKWR
jgi:hypothetical protein